MAMALYRARRAISGVTAEGRATNLCRGRQQSCGYWVCVWWGPLLFQHTSTKHRQTLECTQRQAEAQAAHTPHTHLELLPRPAGARLVLCKRLEDAAGLLLLGRLGGLGLTKTAKPGGAAR